MGGKAVLHTVQILEELPQRVEHTGQRFPFFTWDWLFEISSDVYRLVDSHSNNRYGYANNAIDGYVPKEPFHHLSRHLQEVP